LCPNPVVLDSSLPYPSGGGGGSVRFVIRKNGTVDEMQVSSVNGGGSMIDNKGILQQIQIGYWSYKYRDVLVRGGQKWVFEPALDSNGTAVDQQENATISFSFIRPPSRK